MKKLILRWWPSALTVAVILYGTLSSNPLPSMGFPLFPHLDKLIHAVMFGGFFAALAFDYTRWRHRLPKGIILAFAMTAVIFGGLIEQAQELFTASRGADPWDFAADTAGVIFAVLTAPPTIKKVLKM